MPLMDIPRHSVWEAPSASGWLEENVIPLLADENHLIKVDNFPESHLGNRFTRVPFLKIIVSGGLLLLRDNGTEELNCGRGTSIFFQPETLVALEFPCPCSFLRITFEADGMLIGKESIATQVSDRGKGKPLGQLKACWCPGPLWQPASGLLEVLLRKQNGDHPRQKAALSALIWEIHEMLKAEDDVPWTQPGLTGATLLRYLRDQCHRPLDREDLARAFGVSSGHIGRLLKMHTGKSFQILIQEMRLEMARWYLRQSHFPIMDIAHRCGYGSANYFTQAFRKAEGFSPREWRAKT